MSLAISYQDIDGNPTTLYKLVRTEPDWAASRIDFMNNKIAELEKELADTENNLASLQSKFEDIETVFCDEDGCPLIEPFNGEGLSKWYKALKEPGL
jgi:alpha-ketoglutarate-dependent taurine dioxygenase